MWRALHRLVKKANNAHHSTGCHPKGHTQLSSMLLGYMSFSSFNEQPIRHEPQLPDCGQQ
jgi:hypothetical protein